MRTRIGVVDVQSRKWTVLLDRASRSRNVLSSNDAARDCQPAAVVARRSATVFIYAGPDPARPELNVVPADGSGSAAAISGLQPFGQSTSLAVPLLGPDGPLAIVGRDAGASGTEIFSIPLEEDSKGGKPRPLFAMRVRPSGLETFPAHQIRNDDSPVHRCPCHRELG
jgi:hypothetical protein